MNRATSFSRSSYFPQLRAEGIRVGYDNRTVIDGLDLAIPTGQMTAIIGANACGKSTLLRALGRLLPTRSGSVVVDGRDIHTIPTREVAQRIGVLPQAPTTPEGITVADLVARGRYPYQRWWRQWSAEDEVAVTGALAATNTSDLADRSVDELSGGQRQRVWIAMILAQGTDMLLLDEPTTYLDIAHQVEILDLLAGLNDSDGRTVVAVLHDINHACRYAHHLIAMCGGQVVAEGAPRQVLTDDLVREVFGLDVVVVDDPVTGTPLVVPDRPAHRKAVAS